MADGQWIALLDDDDVWLPQKLELQLLRANASKRERLIIAGRERVIPESGRRERIRPGKGWVGSAVDMNELLFGKEGGVHISTVVAPRQWFLTCPFDETRPRHEDAGWLLRAAAAHRASCWIVDSVVTERAIGDGLSQNGQGGFWESWGWYEEQKALLGVNGRCDFVAGGLAVRAGWDLDWAAAVRLGRELWRMGPARPSLWRRLVKGLLRGGGKRLILGTGLNRLGLS